MFIPLLMYGTVFETVICQALRIDTHVGHDP